MSGTVVRRWTGDDLDRMVEAGIVREGAGDYLWDGEIRELIAEDQPHLLAVKNLRKLLEARFPEDAWSVNTGQPVDLREGFRPQPDLVVLRGPDSAFAGKGNRSRPADVAILIEVSASKYAQDSGEYLREYARAEVAQYWIVNLQTRRVEVYKEPDPAQPGYLARTFCGLEQTIPVIVDAEAKTVEFDGIAVRDVFRNVDAE
jgi:Uma2 family endonuclease